MYLFPEQRLIHLASQDVLRVMEVSDTSAVLYSYGHKTTTERRLETITAEDFELLPVGVQANLDLRPLLHKPVEIETTDGARFTGIVTTVEDRRLFAVRRWVRIPTRIVLDGETEIGGASILRICFLRKQREVRYVEI
jgi:hypothetical protein